MYLDSKLCTPCIPFPVYQISLQISSSEDICIWNFFIWSKVEPNIPTAHDRAPYAESSFNLSRKKLWLIRKCWMQSEICWSYNPKHDTCIMRDRDQKRCWIIFSWSNFDDCWLLCSRLVHPPLKASEIPFDNVNFFVIPQLVCRVLFSPFLFSRCIAVEFETGASLAAFCMCSAAVGLAVCCSLQARPMLQAAGASLVQWLPAM